MPLDLRPLDPGAPGALAAPLPALVQRWEAFLQGARPDREPRASLVLRDGDVVLGWARMDCITPAWFSLVELQVASPERFEELGRALLARLPGVFPGARLEAATWVRHSEPAQHALLSGPVPGGRYELYVEKLYVRRALGDFRSPYHDPFALVSLEDAGTDTFIEVLGLAMSGSLARDLRTDEPARELAEMRVMEADTHDPEAWKIALYDGEPAGVILANRFPLDLEGTFTFIGLCPRFRGRGLGAVLHARGLELLQEMGLQRYLCSTDVRNTPMLRTYARHGCKPFDVRRQYVWKPE